MSYVDAQRAKYHMLDHNKGPVSNPRHDAYILGRYGVVRTRNNHSLPPGSRHAKCFRSAQNSSPMPSDYLLIPPSTVQIVDVKTVTPNAKSPPPWVCCPVVVVSAFLTGPCPLRNLRGILLRGQVHLARSVNAQTHMLPFVWRRARSSIPLDPNSI